MDNYKGNNDQKKIIRIKGMHCPACVLLVERKLKEINGIRKADVSLKKEQVIIEGDIPLVSHLNKLFKKDGYTFFETETEKPSAQGRSAFGGEEKSKTNILKIALISLGVILVFFILNRLGFGSLVNVQSQSSLPTFFAFGLLAGLTSCAALVGGIILSLSKQWLDLYGQTDSTFKKLQPHLMFNTGRLVSYAVLGGILGAIGGQLKISLTFTSILVMAVSVLMFLLGLQMLGVKSLRAFQFSLPKSLTSRLSDERKFKGRYLPLLAGAVTFFLPCGFTITAQGLALLSGSFLQGGLIMLFFALGTTIPLLMIGLAGVKFFSHKKFAATFLKVAGVLVLFFALFNLNSQFNVLGWPSLSNFTFKTNSQAQANDDGFPPLINGKQVIKMEASVKGYSPSYFKVKEGIPVRWEITDTGTSGCTNAVISKSLFIGQINLTVGKTSVKEFSPPSPGKYKFSCWMGMVVGTLEVVANN
ncbi:MAG: sulfite exporter TauE/SafE family protein [Patescibacteria group bacterium]